MLSKAHSFSINTFNNRKVQTRMKENDQSLLQNSLLSRSSESQKSLIEVPLISTEEEFVKTNSTYPKKPDKPGEANQKTELNRSRKQDANNPKPSEDEKDGTKTRELRFEAKSKDEGQPVPQNESPTLRLRMLLGRKPFSAENSDVSDHEDGKRGRVQHRKSRKIQKGITITENT